MSDLISREALIETIGKLKVDYYVDMNGKHNPIEQANKIINCIEDAPTVEAVPVVHGCVKTVVGKMGVMHQECSACGNVLEWKAYPNYCDECGAKLDGADMRTSAE